MAFSCDSVRLRQRLPYVSRLLPPLEHNNLPQQQDDNFKVLKCVRNSEHGIRKRETMGFWNVTVVIIRDFSVASGVLN